MNDATALPTASAQTIEHEYWITTDAILSAPPRIEHLSQYPEDSREIISHTLHEDGTVLIERRITVETPLTLVFTTHDHNDLIYVHYLGDTLVVDINGKRYHLPREYKAGNLLLRTQGGNDTIEIDSAVVNPLTIESGQGDDTVKTAAGRTQVYAGPGNDRIVTGNGNSYVEAGDGNDDVRPLGHADLTIYGGQGQDKLRGGTANNFIDGGQDNDEVIGGPGHNILSGGDGNDWLVAGPASNTLYTGYGFDQVDGLKANDAIFANPQSMIGPLQDAPPGYGREQAADDIVENLEAFDWRRFFINPQDMDATGLILQGSHDFQARVSDDLRLLVSSGAGQKLLHALGKASRTAGGPVIIKELSEIQNGMFIRNDLPSGEKPQISNNAPGNPAPGGIIAYNPSFRRDGVTSVVTLYHELCHAYNALTGTVFPGKSLDGEDGEKTRALTRNAELQVVGLPVEAPPFDFDNDPATPALNTNPEPFSENGILKELGLPPRKQYGI